MKEWLRELFARAPDGGRRSSPFSLIFLSEEEREEVFSVSLISYSRNLLRHSLNVNRGMVLQHSYRPRRDLEAEYVGIPAPPPPTEEQLIRDDPEAYKATLRSLLTTGRANTLEELRKKWQKAFPSDEVPSRKSSAKEASDLSPSEVEAPPPPSPQVMFCLLLPHPTSSFVLNRVRKIGASGEVGRGGREDVLHSRRCSGGHSGFHGESSRGRKEV